MTAEISKAANPFTPQNRPSPQATKQARPANKLAVIAVRRRLDGINTGAFEYLALLLRELVAAGYRIRLVFAPESSFGGSPVAMIAPQFKALSEDVIWQRTLRIGRCYISLSPSVYRTALTRIAAEISSLVSRQKNMGPSRSSRPLDDGELSELAVQVRQLAPDLVVAEYSSLGPLLEKLSDGNFVRAAFLHDLFALRAQALRTAKLGLDVASVTMKEEVARCQAADLLIYASASELQRMAPLLPDRRHVWLRPKINLPEQELMQPELEAARAAVADPSAIRSPRVFMLGVSHAGNLDALRFLMDEIWPLVIKARPQAQLVVAGTICDHADANWRSAPGANFVGHQEHLAEFCGPDTIGIAPARVASGISVKVVKYIQLGMPTVASDQALAGFSGLIDDLIECASDAQKFADAIVRLIDDRERRCTLAQRAASEIQSRFDNAEVRNALLDLECHRNSTTAGSNNTADHVKPCQSPHDPD
ncbi:MAG: glycosyltransferase [Alphaproteobacteria bacterium]|nr:glycosyltransferase [Alphaproteobacteria bacterium]